MKTQNTVVGVLADGGRKSETGSAGLTVVLSLMAAAIIALFIIVQIHQESARTNLDNVAARLEEATLQISDLKTRVTALETNAVPEGASK